mmetsp:Transcript_43618/g.132006  ORF Transcript_43618/g.132006 Transcript_43618/m.132006 type:complete len:241 (-) Transcript_43618:524-1246(-)
MVLGKAINGMYKLALVGKVNWKTTFSLSARPANRSSRQWSNKRSHSALSGALMSTSIIRMGVSPCCMTCLPSLNCWSTSLQMPSSLALLMMDLALVPKAPAVLAFWSVSLSFGISFSSCTPSFSISRPMPILMNSTTLFCSHRYRAIGILLTLSPMLCSAKHAPTTREPLNLGFVMTRVYIWLSLEAAAEDSYSDGPMPYRCSVLEIAAGFVSSKAAKKPSIVATLIVCSSLVGTAKDAL